jgi:hypothetical protein
VPKQLRLAYVWRGRRHLVTLEDRESFELPVRTGAGGDNGIVHDKKRLKFPYIFIFLRSHYLHPHPYTRLPHRLTGFVLGSALILDANLVVVDAECSTSARQLEIFVSVFNGLV